MKTYRYYNWHSQNHTARPIEDDVSPTIPAALGMGGASMTTPVLIQEINNEDIRIGREHNRQEAAERRQRGGYREEVAYTMDTIGNFGIAQVEDDMNTFEHHPQDSRVKQTEVAPTCGVFGNSIERKDCLIQNGTNVTDFKGNNESENCIIDMQGDKSGANTRTDGTCPTLTVPGHDSASCVHAVASSKLSVRRLLPIECERLMGFPDNWTKIPWRGKPAEECPDAPRYKACGNSMGVNCMRWIGLGIEAVEAKHRQ